MIKRLVKKNLRELLLPLPASESWDGSKQVEGVPPRFLPPAEGSFLHWFFNSTIR